MTFVKTEDLMKGRLELRLCCKVSRDDLSVSDSWATPKEVKGAAGMGCVAGRADGKALWQSWLR